MAENRSRATTPRGPYRTPQQFFQLGVLAVLILILITIAVRTIWKLRVAAEQTAVIHMVGTLKTALSLQVMEKAVQEGLPAIAALDRSNPIELLKNLPLNYQTLPGPIDPQQMVGYRWYFDETTRELTYRIGNEDYLETSLPGPIRLRFQVQLAFDDQDGNNRYDAGHDSLRGLDLVALDQARWLALE